MSTITETIKEDALCVPPTNTTNGTTEREYTPKTPFPTGAVGAGLVRGKGFRESLINPYLDYIKKDDAREAGIKGGAAKLGIGKALE